MNVLETAGVAIDIQDLVLKNNFTIEFSLFLEPGIDSDDGVISSGDTTIHFADGRATLTHVDRGDVVVANEAVEAGEWVHFAFVRESSSVRLYINGVNDATSARNFSQNVTIEELGVGLTGFLDGRLDEIRIWNDARTDQEIVDNASATLDLSGGTPAGLQRYYRFDEDAGHIVDATGNAETGHDLHPPTGAAIVEDPGSLEIDIGDEGGFLDVTVASGLVLPTDMAFLPDGRMLVIQKTGEIILYADPTQAGGGSAIYMDISDLILNDREAGLLNIEIDPEFETNGQFYLFYHNDAEERITVSRFVHQENGGGLASRGDATSETVLWQENDLYSYKDHQGGGMSIAHEPTGPDDPSPYKLYITVGEEFVGANAVDLTHPDGKVHRINLSDGSIPTDNPYYDPVAAAAYTPWVDASSAISTSAENLAIDPEGVLTTIYSYGLRNPFRAEYDQESGKLFIGEVGGNTSFSWEDVHIAAPGANMGWPNYEGMLPDPADPGNPLHTYQHAAGPGQDELPEYGGAGAAISGGVVYRGDAFPEEFQDVYFYGDWVRKWIRYLEIDWSSGEPEVINDKHFKNATGQVLSFAEGPDGALYYITTFQTGTVFTFQGAVHRLTYSADNRAPAGEGILLDPGEESSPTAPHTVTFESDVFDPDDDEVTYLWSFGDGVDLDGDGVGDTATSTEANPTYTYAERGVYRVELIVTDSEGAQTVYDPRYVTVGQAPEVTIDTPIDGGTFRAGDVINLTGSAFDPEDGALGGENVYWSMVLLHNDHVHPELPSTPDQPGGLSFTIEDTGHDYHGDVGFIISLTAVDSDGITTSTSVTLRPEESITTFDIPDVPGFRMLLDDIGYEGDLVYDNMIGFHHTLEVPESYEHDGFYWNFSHWEDDPALTSNVRDYVVPETDTTVRPIYVQGDPIPVPVAGYALGLDGTGAADIANVTLGAGGADFTIEGWVRLSDTGVDHTDGMLGGGYNRGQDINFYGGQARLYDRQGKDLVVSSHVIEPETWTHYAFVREAGVLSIYVNGVLDATGTKVWTDAFRVDQLGYSHAGGGDLGGALDEIRLWTTARSAAEIAATMDQPLTGAETGLAALYAFEEDLSDSTGSAPDGILPAGGSYVDGAFDGPPPPNQAPTAVADAFTLEQGFDPATSTLDVLANDSDADGTPDPLTVEIVSATGFGTLEVIDTQAELDARGLDASALGSVEFTPFDPNFVGEDSFTYRVQDDDGAWSEVVQVLVTVTEPAPNQAPVAVDDAVTLVQGFDPVASHLHVLDNDYDPDGSLNMQMIEILSGPLHGTAEVMDTAQELADRGLPPGHYGHVEYTPFDADFVGVDSFTYRVQDDEGAWSDPATVTLTVEEPAPPPVAGYALGLDGTGAADIANVTLGAGGADFSIEGWVRLSDTGVDHTDGMLGGGYNRGQDINFYGGQARLYDRQGKDLVVSSHVIEPETWTHYAFVREAGVLSIYVNGELDVTASGTWTGAFRVDQLGYSHAGGGDLGGALDEIRLWTTARSAAEIAATMDQPLTGGEAGLAALYAFEEDLSDSTGSAPDGILPAGGSYVDGAFDGPPPPNQAPTAVADAFTLEQGFDPATSTLDVLANDSDADGTPDPLTVEIVSATGFGTLEVIDTQAELDARGLDASALGSVEFTPFDPNFVGEDSFTYRVQDDDGAWSEVVQVLVTVTEPAPNQAPVAVDDAVTLVQGFDPVASHLHVLDNDYDPDGSLNMQMIEILSGPLHGTAEVMDTAQELADRGLPPGHYGHVEYTPFDADFVGVDSFTYRVQDDEGAWSDPATVTLTVEEPAPPPVAGYALGLDGTGAADIANVTLGAGGADFSIEGWVRLSDTGVDHTDGMLGGGYNRGQDINFYGGQARLYDRQGKDLVVSSHVIEPETWTHYAFVREAGVLSIYVNGELDVTASGTWTGAFRVDQLGYSHAGGGDLGGALDEIRLWTTARSAAEIAATMDQPLTGGEAGLAALYAFEEDLSDSTGSAPDGILPAGGSYVDGVFDDLLV